MAVANKLALVAPLLLVLAGVAHAEDLVYLESGVVVRGRVVEQTESQVSVELGGGVIRLGRELVERIELDPRDAEQPEHAPPTGNDAEPVPPPTPPTEQERLSLLATWAGPGSRIAKRGRWALAHDHSADDVHATFDVLDLTWRRVHHELYRLGIEPREVRGRLPAVLVPGSPGDAPPPATTASARFSGTGDDLVLSPGPSSHAGLARHQRRFSELRIERDALAERLSRLPARGRAQEDARRELRRLDTALDQARDELRSARHAVWGRSLSEAAAGVVARARGWLRETDPAWLRLGLPAHLAAHDPEDPTTTRAPELPQDTEAPADVDRLRALLDGTRVASNPDAARLEAWTLVHWLATEHPRSFVRCIDAVRSAAATGDDALVALARCLDLTPEALTAAVRSR